MLFRSRIQVSNPGARLKPGMIVRASLRLAGGSFLVVPRDAVIDSGQQKAVYVAKGNGVFERRYIEAGLPLKDRYPVTSGLVAGEQVVTRGVFLMDSQTKLSGEMSSMFGGSKSFGDAAASTAVFKLSFAITPDPPQGGQSNTAHVTLLDPAGKRVSDATVRVTFVMPAMPAMEIGRAHV